MTTISGSLSDVGSVVLSVSSAERQFIKMRQPLVSVIIPIHNVESYIDECLKSVVEQTYQNMEIVCIDDGSTDDSLIILKKYAQKDPRIKILSQENKGLSATRNIGLENASGTYCYFLDSDDMLYTFSVEVMVRYMMEFQLDILYFSGDVIYNEEELREMLPNENRIWMRNSFLDHVYSGKEYFIKVFGNGLFPSPVQIQFYRTGYLRKNGLSFSEGYIHEDIFFSYKAALYAESVMAVKDFLYIRRVRKDSIVTRKSDERNFEGRFTAFYDILLLNAMYRSDGDFLLESCMERYLDCAYGNLVRIYNQLDKDEKTRIRFIERTKSMLYAKMKKGLERKMIISGYGTVRLQKEMIILIGAGKIGQEAAEYFGKHKVLFFADNDANKRGKQLCGIEIKAVEDLEKYENCCDFVICSSHDYEIADQLQGMGISSFYNFKKKSVYELEKFLTKHDVGKYKNIALYGTGKDALRIHDDLKYIDFIDLKYVIDNDESALIGQNWNGFVVKRLNAVSEQTDCIIVASNRYHMAISARLLRHKNAQWDILDPFELQSYNMKNVLVVNNYEKPGMEALTEEIYNMRSSNRERDFDAIYEYVNEVEQMDKIPLFGHVEIETINRCNGICSFCPVNRNDDPRTLHKMSDELFEKIISELEELDYSGRISPFSNNEPFLDTKIIERTKYMRRHLPKARIHLFTNGTMLSLKKYLEIIDFLDELIIDNYNQELKVIKPVADIMEYCLSHSALIEKTDIVLRKPNEILSTRGGDAPNRKIKKMYSKVRCALPYRQFIIRPTGEVSLCCNDPLGKYTMGNVKEEKMVDIWYGDRFREVREMLKKGRENVPHCRFCDTFYLN